MKLRIFGTAKESVVDGEGLRYVVFLQGCPHHCVGCHNPESHSFTAGYFLDTADITREIKADKLLTGLTLSGGEPFEQANALIDLVLSCKEAGLNVWAYTGYTIEQLIEAGGDKLRLLKLIDTLVDGKFIQELQSYNLQFKGSSNQRIINVTNYFSTII